MSQLIARLRDRKNNEDGFTLVELLVVIVILGILASIVVFAVGGISHEAETNAAKTDKRILESAEEAHYATNGSYTTEAGLKAAGFIREESDTKDVCLAGATYNVVDAGTCP